MNLKNKKKTLSDSSLLLRSILDISNIGQRECSKNMGKSDQYLRNYLYSEKEITFGRNFSFDFLASIYHEISIKRKKTKTDDEFQNLLNNRINIKYEIEKKLLLPALERHILALAKIKKEVYNEGQEAIFDSYIKQIFPIEVFLYESFLRDMEYPKVGFKNIDNLKYTLLNPEDGNTKYTNLKINSPRLSVFKDFEKRADSINNFYFVCEKLREDYLPSFISLSEWKEVEMPYFNKGNFLVKKSKINNLKKSNITGGEVTIKSGQFLFEPKSDYKSTKKESGWFYGRKTKSTEFEEKKLKSYAYELDRSVEYAFLEKIKRTSEKRIQEQALKFKLEIKRLWRIINKFTQENLKLQQEIVYYNKLSSNQHVETNNLKKAALKKLLKKGRKITLFDIDKFVNKFGSSKDLEGHLKSHSLFIERATPKDSAINFPDFSTKDKKKRA